jgi:hypothetical protein
LLSTAEHVPAISLCHTHVCVHCYPLYIPRSRTYHCYGYGPSGDCHAEKRGPMPNSAARLKETRHCEHTPSHEEVRGMTPCILNLGDARMWEVSFKLQPLYSSEKSTFYQSDRSLGPHSRSGPNQKKEAIIP